MSYRKESTYIHPGRDERIMDADVNTFEESRGRKDAWPLFFFFPMNFKSQNELNLAPGKVGKKRRKKWPQYFSSLIQQNFSLTHDECGDWVSRMFPCSHLRTQADGPTPKQLPLQWEGHTVNSTSVLRAATHISLAKANHMSKWVETYTPSIWVH